MAKQPGDDVVKIKGELDVGLKANAASSLNQQIQRFTKDLSSVSVKLDLDKQQIEKFNNRIKDIKKEVDKYSQNDKRDEAKLRIYREQIKAQEKLLDLTLKARRAQAQYGSAKQTWVAKAAALTPEQILENANTKRGRQRLESMRTAVAARDEFVSATNQLSKGLVNAAMHQAAAEVKLLSTNVGSVGSGLSKTLSPGGIQKLQDKAQIQKEATLAAQKLAEENKLIALTKEWIRVRTKTVREEDATAKAAAKEAAKLRRQDIQGRWDARKEARQFDLKHGKGANLFTTAGGYDAFNPSQLSRSQASRVRSYLKADEARALANKDYAGVAKAQKAIDDLGNAHKRLNGVLSSGGALVRRFLSYAIGYQALYQVVNGVMALGRGIVDLDKNLFDIQAISQATTGQMVELSSAITNVAVTSKFSTSEIAEATKVLAQAGTDVKDIPAALRAVADFGAATGSDLQVAADVITSFKEVFSDLTDGQAANQLTTAVNISKLTAQDLQTIVSTGAQVAASYNVTSEQMLAAASTLRNAGVKASTIATGMRQAMLEVFNMKDKSAEALQMKYKEMGEDISVDQIKGRFANYTNTEDPILSAVSELKRLGMDSDESMRRIFNVRAENVLLPLIKSYDKLIEQQGKFNFGMPAAEGAAVAMGSLSAKLDNLGGAMTALGAAMTDGPLVTLKKMVDKATDFVEKLREAEIKSNKESGHGSGFWWDFAYNLTPAGSAINYYKEKTGQNTLGQNTAAALGPEDGTLENLQNKLTGVRLTGAKLSERVAELRELRESYNPDSSDPNGFGESIRLITEGLKGTDEEVRQAKIRLKSVAKTVSDSVSRLQTQMQAAAGTDAFQGLSDTLTSLSEEFPDLYEILEQTGKYADPTVGAAALEEVARAFRDAQAQTDDIMKAEAAERKNNIEQSVLEAKVILAGADKTQLVAAVAGYLSSLSTMSIQAAEDRLNAIEGVVRAALQSADPNDVEGIARLQGTLQQIGQGRVALGARKQSAAGAFIAGLDITNGANAANNSAFLNSPEGRRLQKGNPRAFSALQSFPTKDFSEIGGLNVADLIKNGELQFNADGTVSFSKGSQYAPYASGLQAMSDYTHREKKYSEEDGADLAEDTTKKTYIPSVESSRKMSELDFQIEKVREFGGAAGELLNLTQQRNALEMEEQKKAIAVANENASRKGATDEDKKKAAEEQIKLDKMELDAKKDYIEALTKDQDTELKTYQKRAETILEQGGDITQLNTEYQARQQEAINTFRKWAESVGMSEDKIQAEIESRSALNDSLISDKAFNELQKQNSKTLDALQKAVPTDATSGNALLDAQSRSRGWGFTNAETAELYSRQITAKQAIAVGAQNAIDANNRAMPGFDKQQREQAEAANAALSKQITDITNEVNDLSIKLKDLHTTADEQLSQAFGAESVRPYLIALEQSQDAVENYGANLRSNVLSAWEGIGDAIADSVINGEKFGDLMKKLVRDFAGNVLRTSAKTMMNSLGRSILGGLGVNDTAQSGGSTPAAGSGTPPSAAPAGGGFLGAIANALGGGGAAAGGVGATATGTMTVTAGVVNVNGAGAAMEKTAKDMLSGGKGGKGFFDTLTTKVSSLFDDIGNKASDIWKSVSGSLGGMVSSGSSWLSSAASSVGNAASSGWGSAVSWFDSLFAAKGWVGQYAGGYVDKRGIIRGPGTGTSDSIPGIMRFAQGYKPIMVSNKESILTEKASKVLGHDFIGALNSGRIAGFNTGRVADRAAALSAGVDRSAMAPVVHVPEFPTPTLEASVYLNPSEVVARGLRNNPDAVRELATIERVNKRILSASRK